MIMLQNLLATMFQDRRKNYNHSDDHPMTFNRSVRKRLQPLIGCCGFILCCHIFCFDDSFSKTLENSDDHVSDPHLVRVQCSRLTLSKQNRLFTSDLFEEIRISRKT